MNCPKCNTNMIEGKSQVAGNTFSFILLILLLISIVSPFNISALIASLLIILLSRKKLYFDADQTRSKIIDGNESTTTFKCEPCKVHVIEND